MAREYIDCIHCGKTIHVISAECHHEPCNREQDCDICGDSVRWLGIYECINCGKQYKDDPEECWKCSKQLTRQELT